VLSGFAEKIRIPRLHIGAGCMCMHPCIERPEGTCEGGVRDRAGQSSHVGVGGISFSASGSHGLQGDFLCRIVMDRMSVLVLPGRC